MMNLITFFCTLWPRPLLSQLSDPLSLPSAWLSALRLNRISPVAWQHILLNGHYTFQSNNEIIDLETLVSGLKLG
ncbi:hypothetical protein [Serratia fonticola]|uniref:hypothetical protein n=1 Tax=Serratia fonticola TaxID=47917 RepID=UPI003AF3FBB4